MGNGHNVLSTGNDGESHHKLQEMIGILPILQVYLQDGVQEVQWAALESKKKESNRDMEALIVTEIENARERESWHKIQTIYSQKWTTTT